MRALKAGLLLASFSVAWVVPAAVRAQAAAKMITCKDSTKAKDGPGVCKDHGGKVKTAAKAKKTKPAKPSPATMTAAPGGGGGRVWVNLNSGTFHRQGDEWYGKTKRGRYMSEADAVKEGYHADPGKAGKKP